MDTLPRRAPGACRPSIPGGVSRTAVAARLLFRDLWRQRLVLVLLVVLPALFNGIVLATTATRPLEVTIAALVEAGAEIRPPGVPRGPWDLGLLDDGVRTLSDRSVSLVFLGNAAVCFLMCFLAFNLVGKRRDVDGRLVLAGYRAHEVLGAKLLVLAAIVLGLSIYETLMLRLLLSPKHPLLLGAGFFLGGFSYGAIGLLIGALTRKELEGIFLIVLLANIDVGWLQNPIYYAASDRRWIIEILPGFYPTQVAVVGAFTDSPVHRAVLCSLAVAGALLAAALLAFGLRIRRHGPSHAETPHEFEWPPRNDARNRP